MKRFPSLTIAARALVLGLALGCAGSRSVMHPAGTGGGSSGTGAARGAGGAGAGMVGTGGVGGSGAIGGSAGTGAVADPNTAGLRPLRLLTRREYANTIRDLLGDTSTPPGALPADVEDLTSGFAFHGTGTVAQPDAILYRGAAEALAMGAVMHINTLLPCAATATSTATETTCLDAFFGPTGLAIKMFRRPLSTTPATGDVARLSTLYTTGRAAPLSLDFAGAIGLVIEAVLQSAEFLYHWEVDPIAAVREGTVVKLGNYEIANRLSYFLWGTMPDETLFAAAAAGQLADAAGVDTQVRRMLKDPKATNTIADFFTDWLDVDTLPTSPKDPALYPAYTDALMTPMAGELQSFVNAIVFTGTGRFDDLLTGTASFANQALAALYGINGVTGTALTAVSLNPAERSGLLTMAGFMSVTGNSTGSDPPRRGNAIYEKLLCRPPFNFPRTTVPPGLDSAPGRTTRQRFEEVDSNPCAATCHSLIDPLGFAFENYDGIGVYRTTDNGSPVNASVAVTLDGQQKMVTDARELIAAMAASEEVQTCFARQWFRYGLGRQDTARDLASINTVATTFKNGTRDVRELLVGVATSRTFRYRTPGTGEMLP